MITSSSSAKWNLKWPPFELLQRAVLEAKLRPLLPELPPEAQSVPAKQSLRRSAVDENELHHEQPPLSPSLLILKTEGDEEAPAHESQLSLIA